MSYPFCEDYKVLGVLGGTTGMASEYFLADASKLHKLPRSMSFDEDAIRLIAEGKIQVKKLISNHFGFKEYTAAYQYIDDNSSGAVMKVMIDVKDSITDPQGESIQHILNME